MTIDLCVRVRYPQLFQRLIRSAENTCYDKFGVLSEPDIEGLPKIAETYNRLAKKSKADLLAFTHDDIEFLSPDWDLIMKDILDEFDTDVLGVVGVTRYEGGTTFQIGNPHMVGLVAFELDGKPMVKVNSPKYRFKRVAVIDELLMVVRREHLLRHPFDEKTFDEFWLYEIDHCLQSKVGITCNILVKHSKPKEFYGIYPSAMKPIDSYLEALHTKYGFKTPKTGDQRCAIVPLDEFYKRGQNDVYDAFARKFLCESQP
jgi:hypothetical protein